MVRDRKPLACMVLAAAGGMAATAWGHDVVLEVGRTASGQLKVMADLHHSVHLNASGIPGVPGYMGFEPAFHAAVVNNTAGDHLMLGPTANVRAVLVAKDAGIELQRFNGTGFMNVGETFPLGPEFFDVHPTWYLFPGVAGEVYGITLRFEDVNGVYAPSDPITVPFAPTTVPGDANGDGIVGRDDFALIDKGFASSLALGSARFDDGDFNFDGDVDQADYLIIDQAFIAGGGNAAEILAIREQQFGPAYVAALIPEPGICAWLVASGFLVRGRRRRTG